MRRMAFANVTHGELNASVLVRTPYRAILRLALPTVISMAMTMAIKAFFDGVGKTHVHLVAALVMNVFNVLFCWIFIYGNWGAPRMGAPGAGMSAFLATWIGLAIMLIYGTQLRSTYHP